MVEAQERSDLLNQAIAKAKQGQRGEARRLLGQLLQQDARNVAAWLWMAAVIDGAREQVTCLEKVMVLDPDNAAAQRGLAEARHKVAEDLLAEGIAAAERGDRERAQACLSEAVAQDEDNVQAWLYLSRVVETSEDQEICLENILTLDPDNVDAHQKLAVLHQARDAATVNVWESTALEEQAPERAAPTLASAVLGEDYVQRHTMVIPEPEPEPESPALALWAKYDDETLCPYCAAPTDFEDVRCAACGHALWLKTRRRQAMSLILWILIAFQMASMVWALAAPVINVYYVSTQVDVLFTELFAVYVGGATELAPDVIEATLTLLPRPIFFLSWLPFVVSLALTVALYMRWPPMYYILLGSSVLGLLASFFLLLLNLSRSSLLVLSGAIGIIIAIGTFVMVLQLEDDFKRDRVRVLLRVDSGITNGVNYLLRGKQYAAQRMWALAALHFRRAVALLPYQVDGYLALATACMHLKAYELAQYTLEQGQSMNPEDPRIAEALTLLAEKDENT